ncbi:MAG TPA: YceI family protein [Pedobacter sp.]|nr:YceI family protein [Pedobacter sp.]
MTWTRIVKLLCLSVFLLTAVSADAQNYVSKHIKVGIFSSTPLEDIRAVSEKGSGVILISTREVVVQVPVRTLDFDRKLMQEHFNENYIESEKYPLAKFKGKLDPGIDLSRDGEYTVNVSGVLSLHGVDKQRTIPCKISIKAGVLSAESQFKVACADHKIDIPKLVFTKIAEFINVKISGQFNLLTK